MNHAFNKQLCKFLFVFFDDILIYNKTCKEHLKHLDEVLGIMEAQFLFAKKCKCLFGNRDSTLGPHYYFKWNASILEEMQAILDWPQGEHSQSCKDSLVCIAATRYS